VTSSAKWLTHEQLSAWKGVSLMQLQLNARLNKHLGERGLSYQDYLVLATLSDQPDGRRRVVELSDELGWEKSRLSHHITRMCARDLVSKIPCPSDQRGIFVVLTNQGRSTLRASAPHHVEDVQRYFFRGLSPEEVITVNRVAQQVLANLSVDFEEVARGRASGREIA
jgi:DNA-binding MarR family transcriptional regulator